MNQNEAASAIGVSTPTYFRWEKGSHSPQRSHLDSIAKFMECGVERVSMLLSGVDEQTRIDALEHRVAILERVIASQLPGLAAGELDDLAVPKDAGSAPR